jgi:CheY-like chemotaxis protein
MLDKLLSGRRILVVEDEMLVLMMTEDMLADLGCESVTSAATVDQALALIDAEGFDAALLDMNLGGDKSFPVADALAARGVPFIFSTGYTGQDMREGYRDRPVLKKPFRYEDLTGVLSRLFAR